MLLTLKTPVGSPGFLWFHVPLPISSHKPRDWFLQKVHGRPGWVFAARAVVSTRGFFGGWLVCDQNRKWGIPNRATLKQQAVTMRITRFRTAGRGNSYHKGFYLSGHSGKVTWNHEHGAPMEEEIPNLETHDFQVPCFGGVSCPFCYSSSAWWFLSFSTSKPDSRYADPLFTRLDVYLLHWQVDTGGEEK